MHRLLVTSAAYRQASLDNAEGRASDPQNSAMGAEGDDSKANRSAMRCWLSVNRLDNRMSGRVIIALPAKLLAPRAGKSSQTPRKGTAAASTFTSKGTCVFRYSTLRRARQQNETVPAGM